MPQQPPEPTSGPLRSASRIFPLRITDISASHSAAWSTPQSISKAASAAGSSSTNGFVPVLFCLGTAFPCAAPLTIFSNAAADSDCMTTIREIHSMNRRRISAVTRSPLFDPCGKMAKAGLLTRPPNDTFPVIRPVAPRRPVSWTHSSGTVADSHCVPF